MIIPSNRLLLWAVLLLPLAAAGALSSTWAAAAMLAFAAAAAVAALDAAGGRRRAKRIRVELPEIVRLAKDRPGRVPLRVASRGAASVRVGLPLPPSLRGPMESLALRLPAATGAAAAEWPCTPTARGRFRVSRCYFETPSPLGLWSARGSSACRCELRVHPGLEAERKKLAAVFLRRGPLGAHVQRLVGHGRDFEKLREYVPGDSFDEIHWKASARRGRPITKLFQVERTQEVYLAIDASRLSARPSHGVPVLERYITAALVLGLAAAQQGDLFGLIAFDERVTHFARAARGKTHFDACRDILYGLTSHILSPDYGELSAFIRLKLRRRALIVVLTDLGDPLLSESFTRSVELVCRQHLVLVGMIRDADMAPLFSRDAALPDDVHRLLGGHLLWHSLREVQRGLKRRGVNLSAVEDERLSVQLVTQYMNVKARQAL